MFIDAHSVPAGTIVETEICIVGAGAAGIALAREFTQSGLRVALLESGSTSFDPDTQALYSATDTGRTYLDLASCRLRYFGGTTNHWGGWCLPFDAIDFEERPGVAYSGWPFPRAELNPWYKRAQELCQLGPFDYDPAHWGIDMARVPEPFRGPVFVPRMLQQSPPTRFGPTYEPELRQAPKITVYLNANLLTLEADEPGHMVERAQIGTLSGNRFTIAAKLYVLAAGGVENARLLLLSGRPESGGLGNEHDLVGRFFTAHLIYTGGEVALSNPYTDFDFMTGRDGRWFDGFGTPRRFMSFIGLSEDMIRAQNLPSINIFWMYRFAPVGRTIDSLKRLFGGHDSDPWHDAGAVFRDLDGLADFAFRKAVRRQGVPVESLLIHSSSEQTPNPDSRVRLGPDRDALGQQKLVMDWRLTDEDRRRTADLHKLFGAELGRTGFGRLRSAFVDTDPSQWPDDFYGNEHHMGTTRMHRDPTQGVVDENCRVHGMTNLHVVGSSVFPTTGSANPTLTIVALALRLADHLKARLA